MRIYKYDLALTDKQVIQVSYKFQPLSVQVQNNTLCLWAIVDETDKFLVDRNITIIGTGNPINEPPGVFIDTVQQNGYVWHVFYKD